MGVQYYRLQPMEPQRPIKWNSKISVQSRKSNRSSCHSLDRGSWDQKKYSLNKHHTMIEVMSLQSSSKKSDIYDKMLAEQPFAPYLPIQPDSQLQQPASFNPFRTVFKMAPQPSSNRFSYCQKEQIDHTCTCYISCNQQNCPCFRAKDELCVEGYCCPECIKAKARKTVRSGWREQDPKIFCTCKKTKCNKKYCTCFANGIKCGYSCSCQDCMNCDHVTKIQPHAFCIVEEQIKKLEMPQSMEFQPFTFRSSVNSNNNQ